MLFSKSPDIDFFTSAYFLVNLALVLSYPVMRLLTSVGNRDLRHLDSFGLTYENSIIYGGFTFVAIYYLRSSSLREFLVDCLSIGKIIVASLLFFAKFNLCFIYAGVCFVCWMIISYPKYRGRNKFIRIESEEQFEDLVGPIGEPLKEEVEDYRTYQYKDKKMFFV